jgi:hypothetical protein
VEQFSLNIGKMNETESSSTENSETFNTEIYYQSLGDKRYGRRALMNYVDYIYTHTRISFFKLKESITSGENVSKKRISLLVTNYEELKGFLNTFHIIMKNGFGILKRVANAIYLKMRKEVYKNKSNIIWDPSNFGKIVSKYRNELSTYYANCNNKKNIDSERCKPCFEKEYFSQKGLNDIRNLAARYWTTFDRYEHDDEVLEIDDSRIN